MFLPAQYVWFEPVLIVAVVVFFVSLIGNVITFSNRVANALITAVLFAALFGGLGYTGYGKVSMSLSPKAMTMMPAKTPNMTPGKTPNMVPGRTPRQ
jgi:hypothetical protein